MYNYIHSLMTDKKNGTVDEVVKYLLYAVSLIYGVAIYIRKVLYGAGIFKSAKAPLKVISVGNLTLGGTGKTPFVLLLARMLKDDLQKETSVLIRGYGWDEQAMLKKDLPDIPVLVGEDRARSARRSVKLYGTNVAVLDDGFQHWELSRDLDIVLIDSRNPFGNRNLFPRGILRENIESIERAGVVVFTKVDKKRSDITALKDELKKFNKNIIFVEAMHKPKNIYDMKKRELQDVSSVKGRRAILLSSIGDGEYFKETAMSLGVEVVHTMAYSDHYDYKESDSKKILKICEEKAFDFILTTEKDAVKLARMHISFGGYPIKVLNIAMDIVLGKEEFVARLHSLFTS